MDKLAFHPVHSMPLRAHRHAHTARKHKRNAWTFAPLLLATGLRLLPEPSANLSYLVIAAYALLGRAHALRALSLSWLFTMISPGIAPEASGASIGRYAVLFAAATSIFLQSNVLSQHPRLRPFTLATILLGIFIIGHSLLFSPMADVSVLKAVAWMLAMASILSAWSGMTAQEHAQMEEDLFRTLVLILLVSLPLTMLPVGYLRNGTGFQGILNHPQAFGLGMALLGAWTAARMFSSPRPRWRLIALVVACAILVILSEARTAGVALVAGTGLALLLVPLMTGRSLSRLAPGLRSSRLWMLLSMALVIGIALAPYISRGAEHYITKSGRTNLTSLSELYDRSRGRLIDAMLANIEEYPMTGIGFGIASETWRMEVSRDPVLGLPIGASIEKGVTPLMVIEEIGLPGALFVALWLLRLLLSGARGGLIPFAVCLTILLLNMGEATLFSPGGMGLLLLILLGWAFSRDVVRRQNRRG